MSNTVRVEFVIDEHGAVHPMAAIGSQSKKTESDLSKLDKGVKELGKSFGGLKGLVGAGMGALGAGSLVFGLKDIASKTGEIAEETDKFSSITGFGTNASLRYTAALKARGMSAEAGGRMFAFLAKNVQAAERQNYTFASAQDKAAAKGKQATSLLGLQATAFKELGINLGQFHGLSEEAKFDEVITKLEAMKAGAEKTDIAKQLFGRGATGVLPMLQGGALGFKNMEAAAKKFFPEISGKGKQAMEELLVKQAESKMAWEGMEFTMGQQLVPVMTEADSWFSKLASSIEHGSGVWGGLRRDIEGVVTAGKDVVGFLEKMGHAFKIPVEAGGLGAALAAFAGIHTLRHPVKAAVTNTKILAGMAKFVWKHPETAPIALPTALGAAYAWDVYKSRHELAGNAQGALSMFKGGSSFGAQLAIAPGSAGEAQWLKEHAGALGQTRFTGHSTAPPAKVKESALLSRLLEHPNLITKQSASGLSRSDLAYLAGQFAKAHEREPKVIQVIMDGRVAAEGVEREGLKRAARR